MSRSFVICFVFSYCLQTVAAAAAAASAAAVAAVGLSPGAARAAPMTSTRSTDARARLQRTGATDVGVEASDVTAPTASVTARPARVFASSLGALLAGG